MPQNTVPVPEELDKAKLEDALNKLPLPPGWHATIVAWKCTSEEADPNTAMTVAMVCKGKKMQAVLALRTAAQELTGIIFRGIVGKIFSEAVTSEGKGTDEPT